MFVGGDTIVPGCMACCFDKPVLGDLPDPLQVRVHQPPSPLVIVQELQRLGFGLRH